MAGLGETINPVGESGTVDAPVQNQTDVVQTDKRQIGQSTSIETLQHTLYRDWIYSRTFNIDAQMKPGYIFGYLKIHPQDCNPYVEYVSKMFKVWTGGMKVRSRFMANFANGGSFRIGFLPPIFTQKEIFSLPLSTLTAYPNQDLDPKNTDWTEFRTSDQRNIAYHYMKDTADASSVQDFGGWIVFYVVGSLVQSLQTTGSVQMVVETAGDFDFRQLAPLSTAVTQSGPISFDAMQDVMSQLTAEDMSGSADVNIVVRPATAVQCGFMNAHQLNGQYTHPDTTSQYIRKYREGTHHIDANPGLEIANMIGNNGVVGRTDEHTYYPHSTTQFTVSACTVGGRSEGFTDSLCVGKQWKVDEGRCTYTFDLANWDHENLYLYAHQKYLYPSIFPGADKTSISRKPWIEPGTPLQNAFPSENVLSFYNYRTNTVSIQTYPISRDLAEARGSPDTTYLYTLRSAATNAIVFYIRLQANGLLTTSSPVVELPHGRYNLNYEQELSPSSPLPPPPVNTFMSTLVAAQRKVNKHGLSMREVIDKYGLTLSI